MCYNRVNVGVKVMHLEQKCAYCKSSKDVFMELVPSKNSSEYILIPICLRCKSARLEIDDLKEWEKELKKIEVQVSKQIIDRNFASIKFKKNAQDKLMELMKKYPIRKVFEACTLLNENNFSLHKIEMKCKQG